MNIPQQPLTVPYNDNGDRKKAHSQSMRRIYRKAAKSLSGFQFKVHFNPGGPAVMGETYAKIYRVPDVQAIIPLPVVEAYDTSMGLLVRQWDGHNSGRNYYVNTVEQFVSLVEQLAKTPFVGL